MESEWIQALAAIKDSIDAAAQPRFIDWLAIIISFLSMALSGVAIWFAVQVPRKIADRQDKIALFEKRAGIYAEIRKYYALAKCLSDGDDDSMMKITIHYLLGLNEFSYDEIAAFSYKNSLKLMQIPLLFPGVDEDDAISLSLIIVDFLSYYIKDEDKKDEYKKNYEKYVLEFYDKYEAIFHKYIQINPCK